MNEKKGYFCLLDRLSLVSMLKLVILQNKFHFDEVQYCSIARSVKLISRLPIFKNIFSRRFKQSTCDTGDLCQFFQDVTFLSIDIMKKSMAGKFFVDRLNPRYSKDAIRLFLTQKISNDIEESIRCIFIASYWQGQNDQKHREKLLLIRDTPWLNYLRDYGLKKSVLIYPYFNQKEPVQVFLMMFKFFLELTINVFIYPFARTKFRSWNGGPLIAVPYLNGINFNKRNDIFWFENSQIPPQSVLIYFKSTAYPLTPDIENQIKKIGFKYVNLLAIRRNISFFSRLNGRINILPTPYYLKRTTETIAYLLKYFTGLLYRFNKIKCWQLNQLGLLLNKVIYYESFFRQNNVKIHFSLFGLGDDSMASNIAVKLAGGLDVSTHWSNVPHLLINHANAQDVYFCWSAYYKRAFDALPCLTRYFIYSGYIYDSTFKAGRLRAMEHRKRLMDQGADFILTFFDEQHSKNGWLTTAVLERSYLILLSAVLDNPHLGLIIKTKKVYFLRGLNNSKIGSLLRSVLRTNRCLVFNDRRLSNEAAQASDLVVGIDVDNTAALEAALSGIPFVTLDLGRRAFSHYRVFGLNKIVFDDFEDLMCAVRNFRATRDYSFFTESMEYSNLMNKVDPFQDGKASIRVGGYIEQLLKAFKQGYNREQALDHANSKYRTDWGEDKVVEHAKEK